MYPPKPYVALRPRTPEETRAIMGQGYVPLGCSPPPAVSADPIDAEEEAEAIAMAMGAVGYLAP
jgi:hypothetical protein